jgi:beta-ureidopropionase
MNYRANSYNWEIKKRGNLIKRLKNLSNYFINDREENRIIQKGSVKMKTNLSRRTFLANSTAGAALGAIAQGGTAANPPREKGDRREIWVASISLERLEAKNAEAMVDNVASRMEEASPCQPDIICIPETFAFRGVPDSLPLKERAAAAEWIVKRFAEFARKHNCYVICPTYTMENETIYNSAVVIDRQGSVLGAYHKIHPTEDEIESGVTPGPLNPPVFQTDFGVVGIQICFDANWPEGWRALRKAGAEIIFWPSAFPGGRMLSAMAWINKTYIVTSTWPNPTRIIDITGEEIAVSGRFESWVCAPINLEKAFLHIWPYTEKIDALRKKYGQEVRIAKMHMEDWAIIESVSPDLPIKKALAEFEIPLHEEHIQRSWEAQEKARK